VYFGRGIKINEEPPMEVFVDGKQMFLLSREIGNNGSEAYRLEPIQNMGLGDLSAYAEKEYDLSTTEVLYVLIDGKDLLDTSPSQVDGDDPNEWIYFFDVHPEAVFRLQGNGKMNSVPGLDMVVVYYTTPKWCIWTLWANDKEWVQQDGVYMSHEAAQPNVFPLRISGYAVRVQKVEDDPPVR
jgi:hypothetical protein